MKAITIIQPWATLIAIGEKKFETRSWATKHRGELAIHAGKKVDKEECMREPFKSVLAKYGYTADNLPTGCIVAVANLLECHEVTYSFRCSKINFTEEEYFGDFTIGRFAWELADVKQIEPIPTKGQQRLWNWSDGG